MNNELKQVIVVRTDIKMGKGKLASQVAHAAVSSFYETLNQKKELAENWINEGQKKVVLKVKGLNELMDIYEKVKRSNLNVVLIADKGLTQIPEGTITCIGIGPDFSEKIDKITSHLKLL